ncbi:MAG: tRNA pseudouridine(55) synthase TruB [Puniceicoccales bacterium]|jgi:tRNA pseudouridine55 synthase|nr:tRNA pseudouridine(55) synthase TruB [Puniceicoccales bacterium]
MVSSNSPEPDGVLIVDKPAEWTSHDVVARMRTLLRMRRIGHAGTLDPMATGVLVILVGKATKASQYLMSRDKEYEGIMRLGQVTNTQDADGEIMESTPVPASIDAAALTAAMSKMIGDQYQTPPMFSAKKVDGVPLYKLARKGEEIPREPRFIRVSEFSLVNYEAPDASFRVACSKGTYVRTLAHDLGRTLGVGAHLTRLRRVASGGQRIEQSLTLDVLGKMSLTEIRARLIPVWQVVPSHAL